MGWADEVTKTLSPTGTVPNGEEELIYSDKDIEALINKSEVNKPMFNALILGEDGAGKSGIIVHYIAKLPKKTIIIDLDGGNSPLIQSYYKDNKNLIVINPIEILVGTTDVEIDYKKTMAKIKAIVKYVKDHEELYSAIVLDGLSTLLKYAEYQTRIEKSIAPDGGMQLRYWLNRNKIFLEVLEIMKSINLDKFFIGHKDLILKSDTDSSVKQKLNQMIHQRILCERRVELGVVSFIAKIDKSKYNINLEGKEFEFARVEGGKSIWKADELFKGLIG